MPVLATLALAANLAAAAAQPPSPQAPPAALPGGAPAWAKGRILVAPRAGLSEKELGKILAVHGGKGRRLGQSNLFVVDLPGTASETAVAALLSHHPHLKFAELDRRVAPALAVSDPYMGSEWHLGKIGADTAWDTSQGAGSTIAILDTGIDGSHPDLAARMVPGWNIYDNNADTSDVNGHGTAVAGAAAASSNNALGVAAVAGQARLMPIRIADANAYAYWSTVAQGLTWAADHGAKVANISYGGVSGSLTVQNAAQYMKNKGGLVVAAAGNNGIDEGIAPTSTMITVSATDSNDVRTSWSSYGSFVSISAPGQDIWTTTRGGGYQAWWGTSLSSPVVAGVLALMMSAKPSLDATQQEGLLYSTALDLGPAGRDPYYGYGRVNAAAAVRAAAAATPPADTQPPSVSITSPTGGSTSGWVAVNASASDNVGVARVELRVNGSTVATDSSAPYAFSWDSSTVPNGMANLVAVAFDAAGNAASSATVSINVANGGVGSTADTTAPLLSIRNPADGSKVSGSISISTVASDDSGAAGISQTLFVDGAKVASGTGSALSYNWNTKKSAAGPHSIQAVARDAAGNTRTVTVQVSK